VKWEEVPVLDSAEKEREFWRTHELDPGLMQEACARSHATESTTITLRMDPRMLARLKRLASHRYLNYQSMLKQWVAERLEKELEGRHF
jgi:predicted DNA binding CopG/RHH family protein